MAAVNAPQPSGNADIVEEDTALDRFLDEFHYFKRSINMIDE
jgi:hypothetical protein